MMTGGTPISGNHHIGIWTIPYKWRFIAPSSRKLGGDQQAIFGYWRLVQLVREPSGGPTDSKHAFFGTNIIPSLDWVFQGKSMVSGSDFPWRSHPLIQTPEITTCFLGDHLLPMPTVGVEDTKNDQTWAKFGSKWI